MTPRPTLERLLAGVAVAAALSTAAYAQTDPSQPATRADVKAEARAANKAGIPAGEESDKQKPMSSTKTRAERKAETKAANKNGGLGSPGQARYKAENAPRDQTRNTTKTRAERKAETLEAAKQGRLQPAGDAEPGKK
jgi:hypothetical protein